MIVLLHVQRFEVRGEQRIELEVVINGRWKWIGLPLPLQGCEDQERLCEFVQSELARIERVI